MEQDNVVEFRRPDEPSEDPLTEVLRHGARALLAQAIEAEVAAVLASHAELVDDAGRQRLVRNGFLPERTIQTGIGPGPVRQPRVRDRRAGVPGAKIRFTSAILPKYLRRPRSLEELLPWLYLKGISSGDFGEALAALLGPAAPGLSASTISRLKEAWQAELDAWQGRDLTGRRYLYVWADGVVFNARLDQERQGLLVVIGADERGRRELIGLSDGYRESEPSWRELLVDLRRRGLEIGPELAIGDGGLGFWQALRQVQGAAREQRCWVHKAANILNKLPKGLQAKAKQHLQAIWMAETRQAAEAAFDAVIEADGAKYDEAVACLVKDRDTRLAFDDFPAEHWKHVRTTNPVERARSRPCAGAPPGPRAVGHGGRQARAMVFRLCPSAQRRWRRLDGPGRLTEVVRGIKFVDGEPELQDAAA